MNSVAAQNWHSHKILSLRVSTTINVYFCLEALEEAIVVHGLPKIMNTHQGSQFTTQAFTGMQTEHGMRISIDGIFAWRDNVFFERIWRSVKYEEVYHHDYDTVSNSRPGIGRHDDLYIRNWQLSRMGRQTPDQVYTSLRPLTLAA